MALFKARIKGCYRSVKGPSSGTSPGSRAQGRELVLSPGIVT